MKYGLVGGAVTLIVGLVTIPIFHDPMNWVFGAAVGIAINLTMAVKGASG